MNRIAPPRLARWLLGLLLSRDDREFVIGDLDEAFDGRVAAGMTHEAACRAYWRDTRTTLRSFGESRLERRARARSARRQGDGFMRTFLRDARYGLRLLLHKPGFTAVAVVTLALGIGANTAIFTVTHALLLKPLPYSEPGQLVIVNENNLSRGWTSFSVAPANFFDWRSQSGSFATLAAWGNRSFNYTGTSAPERLRALSGTAGFLEMLDGTPIVGRGFRPDEFEPGKQFVAILGHGFWQRAFAGSQAVLNQTIVLNGQAYTIVGVMHPDWRFGGRDTAVFVPRVFSADDASARGAHFLNVIGRLKPGVTVDQAQTELTTIATRLSEAYPSSNKGWGIVATALLEAAVGGVRPMLFVLLGAVGVVLLIACANLANMHLARATGRAREMAIRTAIGAGRRRIVQQLLTENLLLAAAGGGLGLLLAYWATTSFVAAYPTLLPRSGDIRISPVILAFTAGLSIATAMIFGLAPAIAAARADLIATLKAAARGSGGSTRRWLRSGLVVSEMALAVVLLVGAGLLIKSFVRLAHVDPGFQTAQRVTATTLLPSPKYSDSGRAIDFYDRASERLRALPGVDAVALTSIVPISGGDEIYSIDFVGRPPLPPGQGVSAIYYLVGPGYFETMGIPLLKGRTFTDQDREGATRVAVISDTLARLHYPNQDPIGQRIRMGRNASIEREIVGVVGSVKHYALNDKEQAQMYEPFLQMPYQSMTFVLKTAVDPATLAPALRQIIQAIDPDQPVASVAELERTIADSSALPRVQTLLLGGFAAIALLLASVGLYGVMAYTVSQRTQEIGVRMALGAHQPMVLLMVMREAFVLVVAGLAIGLVGAFLLGRALATVLEPMLFQVTPSDTVTLLTVPIVLATVALVASFVPARRATQVDPIQALRNP